MKKLKKIYVEITNHCNLNCSFCSVDNRKKEFIPVDKFKILIGEIKDYTDYIYLHVKGEPLLHPDLKELLEVVEKNNLKVNLTTNGTLLKERKDILKDSVINKINISLHSENKKMTYFEDIFETVEELVDKTIVYRIWTLENGEFDEVSERIVEKIKDYYQLSTEVVDKIKTEQNIKIRENIYVDKDNEFEWPSISGDKNLNGFCMALKTQVAILVDGIVVPCCLDSNASIPLGNIYKESLKDILEGERAVRLRKSFQDRKPCEQLCRNCTYKERFQ
ncbi:MAG: radical SAM protein [Bacilli bacterium]|nr:radical SAM protein [Bacilli bacterium]